MAFLSAVQPRLVASRGCSTKANALPKAWRPSCRRAARCTPRAAADGSEEVSAAARLVVTKYIKPGQTIGLGAGTGLAMNAVLEEIARRIDSGELRVSWTLAVLCALASGAAPPCLFQARLLMWPRPGCCCACIASRACPAPSQPVWPQGVRCVAASSVSASEAAFHGVPMVAEVRGGPTACLPPCSTPCTHGAPLHDCWEAAPAGEGGLARQERRLPCSSAGKEAGNKLLGTLSPPPPAQGEAGARLDLFLELADELDCTDPGLGFVAGRGSKPAQPQLARARRLAAAAAECVVLVPSQAQVRRGGWRSARRGEGEGAGWGRIAAGWEGVCSVACSLRPAMPVPSAGACWDRAKPKSRAVPCRAQQVVSRLGGAVPVVVEGERWEDAGEELDDIFLGDAEIWRWDPGRAVLCLALALGASAGLGEAAGWRVGGWGLEVRWGGVAVPCCKLAVARQCWPAGGSAGSCLRRGLKPGLPVAIAVEINAHCVCSASCPRARRSNSEGAGPRGGDNPYVSPEGHALLDIRFGAWLLERAGQGGTCAGCGLAAAAAAATHPGFCCRCKSRQE